MGKSLTYLNLRTGNILFWGKLMFLLFFLPAFSNAQFSVVINSTDISCFGNADGSATAVASGGSGPYTYLWNTGATTATINDLGTGTYSVTATDAGLSTATSTVDITQPLQLGVQVYGSNQICDLAPDGTATAVPFGGTPPYTYLWSNGGTTPQITGLAAGVYTVTVTDANACTTSGSWVVEYWPEGIWLMDSTVDVTCFGLNNGFSHIGAMSGTPPYSYLWSTGDTTSDVSNLAPGNYTVTVTDANGCTNFWNVSVNQPAQLFCNASATPGSCGLQGSATVDPSGGTTPYSVLWSTGSTNFTISAPPGNYGVTVTDANDCTCSAMVTIDSTSSSLNVNTTVDSNAGCTIGGSATATASGGTGNYAYSWDNGQMTATATNLTAGNHSVTAIDVTTGCMGNATANIPSAPQLTAGVTLVANATCLTGGSATVAGNGGTPPYTFNWDNGQTTATATNLGAGPHSVTITDSKGCVATATINIGQTQGPTVTAQVNTNATCTMGGSATAVASGGTGSYTYLWDNGQMTATATNLSVGPHMVTITDAAGCSASASVTIAQPNAPTLAVTNTTNADCNGSGGSASVAASGGSSPYSYLWSTGATTATVANLAAGTYTATVTDAASCTAAVSVTIAGSMPPNVVITASANAKCDQPGSATASATGGMGGYTYLWDNNETTATATNLSAGTHSVTVTDAAGCTGTASVTIGFTNNGFKIGDYVWYDDDQDGFQHPLETNGVANVTVTLLKAGPDGQFGTPDDQIIQTVTTNANGKYEFTCVTPGVYIIAFNGIPSGYEFTKKDFVNNDCKDSDAKSNGKTDPFTIVAGQTDNLCFDAGIHIFCDNVFNAGAICCNQTICEGETPAQINNSLLPWGGTGPIQYQWLQLIQMGPAPPVWTAIPGATGVNYQPGPLYETSYFMRCARREGCINFLETNIVTITVLPAGSPSCPNFTGDLDVNLIGPNTVLVEWTTAFPETDQYLYSVEHSTNKIDWQLVETVTGKDNNQPNSYSIVHQTPVLGENHYRVKRTNSGGIESYSQIRSLDLDVALSAAISITPNPVSDFLTIKNVAEYDADVMIQLINTAGAVLHTLTIPQGTLHYEELPVKDLASGLYMARIRFGNGDVRTVKITKF